MKDTKHTPGQWEYRTQPITLHGFYITQANTPGDFICEVGGGYQTIEEVEANAKLIAAAPELLEASSELLDAMNQYSFFLEGYGNGSASISEVREASSKMTDAQHKLFDVIQKAKGL